MKRYLFFLLTLLLPLVSVMATGDEYWNGEYYNLGSKFETFSTTISYDASERGTGLHDEVFIRVYLARTMTLTCSTRGSESEDTYITLYDSNRSYSIEDADYEGEDEQAHLVTELSAGTYFLSITNFSSKDGITVTVKGKYNNVDSNFHIGDYSTSFIYTDTIDTSNYSDSYGLPTSDVSYSFTTTRTFDFDTFIYMTSTGSAVDVCVYLLDENGNVITPYGWYEDLPAGSYQVILEGKDFDGEMSVEISCNYPRPENYYDTDIFNRSASYVTEEFLDGYPDIMGNALGEPVLLFELETPMRVHISQTGGTEQCTNLYLWNVAMEEIANDADHPSDFPSIYPDYASMSITLGIGQYYVVCESMDEYTDNRGRTVTILIECEDGNIITTDTTRNYILTRTYTDKNSFRYRDRIDYYDGLGRPEQTVSRKGSPYGKDLVTIQEYDAFGRESNAWLPRVAEDGSGNYVPSSTFKNLSPELYGGDAEAYTLPVYEESPLNRILERYGAGKDWHDNNRSHKYGLMTNVAGNDTLDCALFYVEYDTEIDTLMYLKYMGSYTDGTLMVTRTEDEDGNRNFVFTDKWGRTVLTRSMDGDETHDTYYVPNIYGQPFAVLPPSASEALVNSNDTCWISENDVLKQYAYLYRYHASRGTICTAKRTPGSGWTQYRYDQNSRLVFTQDPALREQGKWKFTIPDKNGNICLSGFCENTEISLQNLYGKVIEVQRDSMGTFGYTIKEDVIELVNPVIHTVNFYDDYSFRCLSLFADTALDYVAESGYDSRHYTDNSIGLLTGTLTAVLSETGEAYYVPSVMYYDYQGRLVQIRSGNHLNGVEIEKLSLDFTGNITSRKHEHTAENQSTQTEVYGYRYDHTGRLLTTTHNLNGSDTITLSTNTYDALGRLIATTCNGKDALTTSYAYNIRNWMTNLNNPLYSQSLTYGYGGNINTQQWTQDSRTRQYTYTYDGLSKLTHAVYTGDGNYTTSYAYDRMGNITSLQRYDVSLVDNLTLSYNGNQLTKVEDATGNTFGFKNGANTDTEYFYDANGNLTKDLNKNITNISYNSLNLPSVITFSNGNTVTYTYAADGRKLRTVHVIDGDTTTTDYCGNVIYENGTAKLLLVEGGYVDLTDNSYHFYIKDHLGNNRIVADANGNVEESNQYYPFGLSFANTNSNLQPYKYNGKELDTKNGLNWYDYGARHYDAALGRWHVMDPLAEKDYYTSPYAYCLNNPICNIDPNGKSVWTKLLKGTSKVVRKVNQKGFSSLKDKSTYVEAFADIIEDAETIIDENASIGDRVISGISLASELLPISLNDAKDASRLLGIHGNSKMSEKAQHAYDVIDTQTGKRVKTGVSGGRIRKDGKSSRAEQQVRKWNKESGYEKYESEITHEESAGEGARDRILEYEKIRAKELRDLKELDKKKHIRP